MSTWVPSVGESAYVLTQINDQWRRARRVTVTGVLKTKIKTTGGDFPNVPSPDGTYQAVPERYSFTKVILAPEDSEVTRSALRGVTVAIHVSRARLIGARLCVLPLDGEGAEAAVAEMIQELSSIPFDGSDHG